MLAPPLFPPRRRARCSGAIARAALLGTALLLAAGPAGADPVSPPSAARVRAWQTGTGADKLEHASLSFTLALGIGFVTTRPAAGASGAIALGVAKEFADARTSHFDRADLAADAVGVVLGTLAAAALTR